MDAGHAMGRVSVPMVERTRSRSLDSRRSILDCVLRLGGLWSEAPDVPETPSTGILASWGSPSSSPSSPGRTSSPLFMFWPTQAFNVYGHDPVQVGIRGIPVGFSILAGACIVLWLLSVFRGHNRELLIVSSVLMTAGCGALAVARRDNLSQLWGLLIVAGLGIGGIVVPASIISESPNHFVLGDCR